MCILNQLILYLLYYFLIFLQAPTARQVKYKEKVQELRRKKDTGLSKEQKEKYMVRLCFVCSDPFYFCYSVSSIILNLSSYFSLGT